MTASICTERPLLRHGYRSAATPLRLGASYGYSLIATCKAHGKNPLAYLTDVLTRIGSHPQSKIDELLPDRWQPAAV